MRVLLVILLLAGCASNQPTETSPKADEAAGMNTGERSNLGVNAGMGSVRSFRSLGWPF